MPEPDLDESTTEIPASNASISDRFTQNPILYVSRKSNKLIFIYKELFF